MAKSENTKTLKSCIVACCANAKVSAHEYGYLKKELKKYNLSETKLRKDIHVTLLNMGKDKNEEKDIKSCVVYTKEALKYDPTNKETLNILNEAVDALTEEDLLDLARTTIDGFEVYKNILFEKIKKTGDDYNSKANLTDDNSSNNSKKAKGFYLVAAEIKPTKQDTINKLNQLLGKSGFVVKDEGPAKPDGNDIPHFPEISKNVGSDKKTKKPKNLKRIVLSILIPFIIIVAGYFIYKLFLFNPDKLETESVEFGKVESIIVSPPEKVLLEVNDTSVTLIPVIGENRTIKVNTNTDWEILQIPSWLKVEPPSGSATDSVVVFIIDNENIGQQSQELLFRAKNNPEISKAVEVIITKSEKWTFDKLSAYIEEIRGISDAIDFDGLFKHVDPGCEVYYYIKGEKYSSEDITTFVNKIKFGAIDKIVPNSLKYNSKGKIIEFGQE